MPVLADYGLIAGGGLTRQFEGKNRAQPRAIAMCRERSSQFLGGQGAAMQTEAMAILSGGKPMIENPGEILRRDANAVINHCDPNSALFASRAQDHLFVVPARIITRIFGVAHQVNENLEGFVLVSANGG